MTSTKGIKLWQCGACGRYFAGEQAIRAHQDLFTSLHAHDPEIDEHDGHPWRCVTLHVGETLEYGARWARLIEIEVGEGESLIVETPGSRRHRGYLRMSPASLAEHLSGSREATPETLRAFAAAISLDIDVDEHREVDLVRHIEARYLHWYDREPGRAMVELAKAQLTVALMTFNESRRPK